LAKIALGLHGISLEPVLLPAEDKKGLGNAGQA
jgi:hypothetical protein